MQGRVCVCGGGGGAAGARVLPLSLALASAGSSSVTTRLNEPDASSDVSCDPTFRKVLH